ncbi:acetylornithine deacetylase [Xanthobacter sp. V0B-10]|uniref:acetylornithine deacetylase n=1 Tax=Xanthobacter albus TaxID=3119929 RepID=UPI00372C1315
MTARSLDLLERLVAFPTISSAPNRELVAFVVEFLAARGIAAMLVPNAEGTKANLFATIGPRDTGGVMLSGHTDVVPVEGQAWSGDPFRLREEDGRLIGRGTTDMKGFLACALAAADRASRMELALPLHLAFSYDEEIGCVGVRGLLDALAQAPFRPQMAIIGEPTSMRVATGHKGKTALRALCCGREAHSALAPTALNAIHLAAAYVEKIRARQALYAERGARDPAYDVPYTTFHVGRIAGGTALNIVPNACTLELEFRNLAQDDPAVLLAELEADAAAVAAPWKVGFPEAEVRLTQTNSYPGLATADDAPVVAFAQSLTGANARVKLAFGTEGGLFSTRLAIPTVVCGPGSMDQGHKPDEWVARDQIAACDRFMDALLARLAA